MIVQFKNIGTINISEIQRISEIRIVDEIIVYKNSKAWFKRKEVENIIPVYKFKIFFNNGKSIKIYSHKKKIEIDNKTGFIDKYFLKDEELYTLSEMKELRNELIEKFNIKFDRKIKE